MDLLHLILRGVSYVIIADVILSWVSPRTDQFPRNITSTLTEPLYKPIRAILNPRGTGGLDFAPLVVLICLQGIGALVSRAFSSGL